MEKVPCYVCGASDYRVIFPGSQGELQPEHIAARQGSINKVYQHNWVRCSRCGLVYANPAPDENQLAALYTESDQGGYIIEEENIRQTYGGCLRRYIHLLPERDKAVDIGAGSGFFLKTFRELGFREIVGVEPSKDACAKADPSVAAYLLNRNFNEADFAPASIDLITCFQTLEHFSHPEKYIESFSRLLKPGGLVFSVAHDFGALGVKLLGNKHPIVNAGHLALFDKKTLPALFGRFLQVEAVFDIRNRYSVAYWIGLFPLSDKLKKGIIQFLPERIRNAPLSLKMGNIGIIARNPSTGKR